MIERIEINLLPAEYRIHSRRLRLPRETVYPILGLLLFALGITLFSFWTRNSINQIENEIAMLDNNIQQNRHIQTEINELRRDKQIIDEKVRALERINVNREKWVRLMELFARRLPTHSYLTSLREEQDSKLRIEGRTFSFPEVATFMTRLKESEYITHVELSNIEQIDDRSREYRFGMVCSINPDAGMEIISEDAVKVSSR
ncbi:PilN domain-containing protein [Chitinispirillales bacterium ANBcel5]|uniref:PilN domain-containing protein n=1 Tax=Cellulosispirillum alkaliphilum TaxID=3039283 RepID=UPI002A4E3820|nr:PilN domain-containing protein [Chitinispirillales bacterium ANBcel5]